MTTITYKDGVVACDTQVTADDTRYNCDTKITIINPSLVIAGSGDSNEILRLEKFFREYPEWEENLDRKPTIKKTVDCILVSKGKPYTIYKDGFPDPLGHPFFACGSGWKFAMSGMLLGLSAVEAIKHASQLDIYTNDRIRFLNVKELQAKDSGNKGRRAKATSSVS